MESATIFACCAALALAELGWGSFLTALNYRNVARRAGEVPERLRGVVTAEDAAKAAAYSKAGMALSLVEEPVMTALALAAAGSGLLGALDRLAGAAIASPYWRGAAFLSSSPWSSRPSSRRCSTNSPPCPLGPWRRG